MAGRAAGDGFASLVAVKAKLGELAQQVVELYPDTPRSWGGRLLAGYAR